MHSLKTSLEQKGQGKRSQRNITKEVTAPPSSGRRWDESVAVLELEGPLEDWPGGSVAGRAKTKHIIPSKIRIRNELIHHDECMGLPDKILTVHIPNLPGCSFLCDAGFTFSGSIRIASILSKVPESGFGVFSQQSPIGQICLPCNNA